MQVERAGFFSLFTFT
ncbi:hypothetical protein SPV_2481 [Streptococcus pneumoniae]|nr:hypothetical protein SPV_2481 [Streptococcus pneumoniae]